MAEKLNGKRVAILVTDGFEQVELTSPRQALEEAGAQTVIAAPKGGKVRGWNHDEPADSFDVDVTIDQANADHFDALVLPGGVRNPDHLRRDEKVVAFVRSFFNQRKPVAAICHGPWMLIEADVCKGRRMTSYHSIKTDVKNAGAEWVDEEVVVDNGLITSRNPDDLPAFNAKTIDEVAAGKHAAQHA